MKKIIIFVVPIFLLLLHSFLSSAAEQPNPVRDIDGKKLRAGPVAYYILPVMNATGSGGGVTLGSPVTSATGYCPRTVVQESSESEYGLYVIFTPVDPKKGVIRVSTDLNIRFNAVNLCGESNVWKLEYAEEIGQYIIGVNGTEGNPGRETIDNWFKIEEYKSDYYWYNLRFCPTVCDYCKPICRDVGIYIDHDGTRRLALSDEPFRVRFKEA